VAMRIRPAVRGDVKRKGSIEIHGVAEWYLCKENGMRNQLVLLKVALLCTHPTCVITAFCSHLE
jgi:hypothetical protein